MTQASQSNRNLALTILGIIFGIPVFLVMIGGLYIYWAYNRMEYLCETPERHTAVEQENIFEGSNNDVYSTRIEEFEGDPEIEPSEFNSCYLYANSPSRVAILENGVEIGSMELLGRVSLTPTGPAFTKLNINYDELSYNLADIDTRGNYSVISTQNEFYIPGDSYRQDELSNPWFIKNNRTDSAWQQLNWDGFVPNAYSLYLNSVVLTGDTLVLDANGQLYRFVKSADGWIFESSQTNR